MDENRGAGDGEIVVSSAHPVPHDTPGATRRNTLLATTDELERLHPDTVVRVNPLRVR